jgi:uncharacterized protein (DUF305 family)
VQQTPPRRWPGVRVLAVAGLAAVLGACASPAPEAPSTGSGITGQVCCAVAPTADTVDGIDTAYNGWDTAFIGYMAPHDAVAGQMAALAATQAQSQQVKNVATAIDAEPGDRYLTLSAMAQAWGQPVPSTDPAAAGGHDHGGGRTEADDLAALTPLTGAAFDRTFLDVMIRHHQAGLKVAQSTIDNGTNPQAKDVAQQMVATQTPEVAQMQQLQGTLG